MTFADTRFHKLLKAKIDAELDRQIEALSDGKSSDWADYKRRVGYVAALREVLELCEDVEKESMRAGDPKTSRGKH